MKNAYNQPKTTSNQETGTMSQGKRPSHKAYAVEKLTKDDKQKSHWTARALIFRSILCPSPGALF
jgi:hypothetical protein